MRTFQLVLVLLIACCISLSQCEKKWWQKAVIYQIYPRSLKDSDGDGIGDLNGITQSLWHIKNSGIDAIWLSPIFKSPMYDFGYDIADFKQIHSEYGTMSDFENMTKLAKSLGIHVLLDFVPNHSSNESVWFQLSANRTKGYENYFIWEDGRPDPENPGKLLPPNNWISVFRDSAWEYNPTRGQYYLHQFVVGQPDLNYREPRVVEEMKSVVRFWLEKGVSGFRVDAVPFLFEVDKTKYPGGKYPDEPRSSVLHTTPQDYDYLSHIYTLDQEETYDMIYQWRDILDEYEKKDGIPKVMLTEGYTDIKNVMKYFGNATHEGAHLPFNFEFLNNVNSGSDARDMKFYIYKWMIYQPISGTANWVNGNHDNKRMASRHGIERADMMNMIALILPGTALTYQGEELAMTDGEVTWEETKDPAACNTHDPINYVKASRDPARTPYHWDDNNNAGFTSGNYTWLPVAQNYKEVNLKAQIAAGVSHYKFYKDLVALKKTETLADGDVDILPYSESVLIIKRSLTNKPTILGILNLASTETTLNLQQIYSDLSKTVKVYTSGVYSKTAKGTLLQSSKVTLSPHDAMVLITYY